MRILGKGSRPRGAEIRCYLKGLFEPQHHHRIYMNKIKQFKENSMPLGLKREESFRKWVLTPFRAYTGV